METNINTNTSAETTHTIDFSDKLYKIMIGIIVITAIFLVGELMYQFRSLPQNMPREVSVSGEGKAYIKPDIALVTFGVTTQELKSQDAVNKNNQKMNAVIKAMKDLGIEDKDIQTTLYNLTPVYDYPTYDYPTRPMKPMMLSPESVVGVEASPIYVQEGRIFKGYSLEQQIAVKIRNFDNINSVLDKATSNGATNVGQLQFTVDNPEKVRADARAKAIENAKEKLQSLVVQSGLKVGKLINVYEGYNGYPGPMYGMGGAMESKDMANNVAPQIQTGQQEVSSTVTLTYQVK